MDDTKLLELAGRAAGEQYDAANNPLERDDLALRLAVTCGLVIDTSRPSAGEPFKLHHCGQQDFTDRNAAVRRCITRAAAEIARAQGEKQ